ncbi:hypothetical protein EBR21_15965, partial [bacterium]|nr:hypothetical protein [bacterium]
MSIAVFEHDKQNLADLIDVLQESGHLDAFCTHELSKLVEAMNLAGMPQQNMRVDVNLLIL